MAFEGGHIVGPRRIVAFAGAKQTKGIVSAMVERCWR